MYRLPPEHRDLPCKLHGNSGFVPSSSWLYIGGAVLSGIIWLVVGDLLYFACLHRLGVSITVPITSAYPLLVIPASWFFLHEPMTPAVFLAALLIVGGIVLIAPKSNGKGGLKPSERPLGIGLLLAFLTMSCWAFGLLTNKIFVAHIPVPQLEWYRALGVTGSSFLLYRIFPGKLTVASLFANSKTPWRILGEVIIAGALGLTLGNLFFTYSVLFIPVNIATCVVSLRPFIAALFALLLLKEPLTKRLLGGIFLIVAGVLLLSLV
ncbi:MAG TPA: DMT family transporter [Synergistaceae bacterium]|nr:DMT family transporter [Synergistaceae bacterium]